MTRYIAPRLLVYSLLVSGSVVTSVALARPEPIVLGVPFAVVLVIAALKARAKPAVSIRIELSRTKGLEGDEIDFVVYIISGGGSWSVEFVPDMADGLELVVPPPAILINAASRASTNGRIRCRRWGVHRFGAGRIEIRDPAACFRFVCLVESSSSLRVYPRPESLRELIRPRSLHPRFGSLTSRAAGVGLEFADIRDFVSGDQRRHINWKATARRGHLNVNLFHPEWSSTVVLVVDAYVDIAGETASSLDLVVHAAVSAAAGFLGRRDRVGLLCVGGRLRWLQPGMGLRQLYRIVDALMQTEMGFSLAWPNLDRVPKGVIPPGALVLALTPLVDSRAASVLLDLRARGTDVAVVEIEVGRLLAASIDDRDTLALRLWSLHREAVRYRYRRLGVPVASWNPGSRLQLPISELQSFRRAWLRISA